MSDKRQYIPRSLTMEEVNEYFNPLEEGFHGVAKVISFITQIPLSDISDTAKCYNSVKLCLAKNGFPVHDCNSSEFHRHLDNAKDSFISCS